jgi:hypothetical protein
MTDEEASTERLPAGDFSAWLEGLEAALRGEQDSDVPCDGCTACCASSQFVHVAPDEVDALAHIPGELLFPAPGLPRGHVLMGYDEQGRCPLLTDGGCSIYDHRPRTCRTYDCRVFPASGVALDDPGKAAIARRAERWQFAFPNADDRTRHEAVRAAATFLQERRARVDDGLVPVGATPLAVLALEVHGAFLEPDADADAGAGSGRVTLAAPEASAVEVTIARRRPRP